MSNNLTLLSSTPQKVEEKEAAPPKLSLLSSKPSQESKPAPAQLVAPKETGSSTLQLLSSSPSPKVPEAPAHSKPSSLSLLSSGSSSKPTQTQKADAPVPPMLVTKKEVETVTLSANQSVSDASTAVETQAAVADNALPVSDAEAASNNGALAITFVAVIMAVGCAVAAAVFYLRSKPKASGGTLVGQAPKAASEEAAPKATPAPTPKPVASDPHAVNEKIPSKPVPSVSDDPIIQFLNGESDGDSQSTSEQPEVAAVAPAKPAANVVPPRKPGSFGKPTVSVSHPTPPPKPGSRIATAREAPNAPTGLKAPTKPKKRF